jgi:hypothetical protein
MPASVVQLAVVAAAGASLGAMVIVAGHETVEIAGQHSRGVRSEELTDPAPRVRGVAAMQSSQ